MVELIPVAECIGKYYLNDHLGNTRVSFGGHSNGNPEIMQVTDYYPFGMVMAQQNFVGAENSLQNKYLYNGKELQDDNLAGAKLDWYDYGARFYDPSLARWHMPDPLAEKAYGWSPYRYGFNNPIRFTDPTGMWETKYEDEQHNLLLETNDGSDAVVTVTDDKRAGFDAAVKGTTNTNDVSWNNSMKKYALGFELSGSQESALSSLNSDWSRRNAISFWQNPTAENASAFAFSEALSQWTNPYLVVGGLSAGVAGFDAIAPRTNVYRVYGGDSPANGYSWTPTNPNGVSNYRNAAGLPSGGESGSINTGQFVIEGSVNPSNIMNQRSALPLDGNAGGLKEYIINPKGVRIIRVSGVNPEF